MDRPERPLSTFLSYSHQNQRQRKKLREHFAPLEREGLIRLWDDREMQVGQAVDGTIQAQLDETEVFILLVSPEFIASDYCSSIELQRALERHREGRALLFPIIVSPCDWRHGPLGSLLVAPTDGRPITSWSPRDAGWADATSLMRKAIGRFRERRLHPELQVPASEPPRPPAPAPGPRTVRGWRWIGLVAGIAALAALGAAYQFGLPHGVSPPAAIEAHPPLAAPAPAAPAPPSAGAGKVLPAAARRPMKPQEPAPPAERPAAPLVELTITSEPAGIISVPVDGKPQTGRSPFVVKVPPGPLQLQVSGIGEQSFARSESIVVAPAAERQALAITVGKGEALIRSSPAAHVTVDGASRGDTPLKLPLYEGEHTIHFECDRLLPACAEGLEATQTVRIQPGQTTEVTQRWPAPP